MTRLQRLALWVLTRGRKGAWAELPNYRLLVSYRDVDTIWREL